MASKYSELLKDPRWQRKRLEIMERDNWTCQKCGDKENTLHVHHKYYYPDNLPWDYPDYILITLCEECHGGELINHDSSIHTLIYTTRVKLLVEEIHSLGCSIGAIPELDYQDTVNFITLIEWFIENYQFKDDMIDFAYQRSKRIRSLFGRKIEGE